MKSGQITVFEILLAYKHKFNFFGSFVPFYCKRPILTRPLLDYRNDGFDLKTNNGEL